MSQAKGNAVFGHAGPGTAAHLRDVEHTQQRPHCHGHGPHHHVPGRRPRPRGGREGGVCQHPPQQRVPREAQRNPEGGVGQARQPRQRRAPRAVLREGAVGVLGAPGQRQARGRQLRGGRWGGGGRRGPPGHLRGLRRGGLARCMPLLPGVRRAVGLRGAVRERRGLEGRTGLGGGAGHCLGDASDTLRRAPQKHGL